MLTKLVAHVFTGGSIDPASEPFEFETNAFEDGGLAIDPLLDILYAPESRAWTDEPLPEDWDDGEHVNGYGIGGMGDGRPIYWGFAVVSPEDPYGAITDLVWRVSDGEVVYMNLATQAFLEEEIHKAGNGPAWDRASWPDWDR